MIENICIKVLSNKKQLDILFRMHKHLIQAKKEISFSLFFCIFLRKLFIYSIDENNSIEEIAIYVEIYIITVTLYVM
jgi:hypothetical protein